ncbi:Ulp1 family isopeptidase [Bradyrhizobium sp. CCGUVB1N3]|uniref:XopAD/skwp family type III secretion system effector n=1 Tax=Bradyrhizobium sp. CCGUVB1N3 TaxID=2949629 RepID=UPI0020B45F9D|nr:XopAD/skwp family type III secretion system effector [Bradyrhizobium sp. CCGUVB1N3]MCP3475787.1 Ulp1 family isopeptidase [Bradyrhizobium sp. CCGUVB1N3]
MPGDDRCDTLADPSLDAHRTGAGAPYAANGGRERSAGHKRGAQTRKPSSSRSGVDPFDADLRPESSQTGALQLRRGVSGRDAEWGTHRAGDKGGHSVHDWRHTTYRNAQEPEGGLTHSRLADRRDNGATESSRTGTLAPHAQSASLLPSRAGKRRFDELAEHRPHAATSERYGRAELESGKVRAAIETIDRACRAHDFNQFSRTVVVHTQQNNPKQLKMPGLAAFLQKAATLFKTEFVPLWEDNLRYQQSWGYATTCNAVSREAGGQAGIDACKAMAARLSGLDDSLMRKVDLKAFSLFATSFGRHTQSSRCRNGTIRIAEFFRDDHEALQELNEQSLSLLANGFSKWPERAECRQATVAIASEVSRRARGAGLSHATQQQLSNLANAFCKWPDEAKCCRASVVIADEVSGRAHLSDFNPQALTNLANAFCKWPDRTSCRLATIAIAREVAGRRLGNFEPQGLANLVNGFDKWPDERPTRRAAVAIAGEICRRDISAFTHQNLSLLANGFSKWPDEENCRAAIVAIAGEVLRRGLGHFTPQALVNLVSGFSKRPEEADCRAATAAIAGAVLGGRLRGLTPQGQTVLVNGFSKWPEDATCRAGTVVIASEVLELARRTDGLSDYPAQDLAVAANGFSKWPHERGCRQATVAIADEILRLPDRLSDCTPQELASLANGFSKWQAEPACGEGIGAVARETLGRADRDRRLTGFTEQSLSNLANAFSKWPDQRLVLQATIAIAGEVLSRSDRLSAFTRQQSANLVNGFCKWPTDESCRRATAAIARELCDRNRLSSSDSQGLANLLNGFGKWPADEDCSEAAAAIAREILSRRRLCDFTPQQQADLMNSFIKWRGETSCTQVMVHLARDLGRGGERFAAFNTPQLSMIANAVGRSFMRAEEGGEIADATLLKDRLQQLVHYLHYANDRLEQADVLSITNIFKAIGRARLFDELGLLAPTGLTRLEELLHASGFARENNLESMGNICIALLPLARSPQKSMQWHRRQALNLLNDLQPVLEQKIAAYLAANTAERRTQSSFSARRPALSIFQVLKARKVLETLYRRPYVEGNKSDLAMRRQQLEHVTKKILADTRALIEGDLSNMSWNLIAQIEADDVVDALDSFMSLDEGAIQTQHPSSVFDTHQVLRTMDHEPRPPQGKAGLMQLPVVDMQGRRLPTAPETRYSMFHRLTSGALPVVAVQLPKKPSPFMLRRVFCVDDVPYRMDLFGGSKLKAPKPTLSQIAAVAPGEQRPAASGGKLLAIPYADTAPGTAFEQLSRAWAPFKEAYYYTQRRGFAAPPVIKDLGPHDYALEGAFKLSLLPDRPAGEEHPFKLIGPDGPIALRPHDGCGFIRASLAERMLAVRRGGQQEGPDRLLAYGEERKASLPAAALQFYSRSEQVAQEVSEKTRSWLERRKGEPLSSEQLYRTVTAGHIEAPGAIAVPSDDGHLHVPKLKSDTLAGAAGVLIGRSPYDKANLRPFTTERVKTASEGDSTAAFLDKCVAFQYSFNVAEKSGAQLAADDPTFFAKGILIVVPDEVWPANYRDRGLVMSAEDVKSHSSWTERKDRVTVDTSLDCVGMLQATEVFAPGSLVAVPPDEQKKLDGDFDGDTVIIIGDRPQLYEHVRQFDAEEQARGVRSLKPPKSHTPAIEDGRYQFSRGNQILAATQDTLETYSTLQRNFLAQSDQARRWFAERAIFGIYEGVDHEFRQEIRDLLNREETSGQDIQATLERAMREIDVAEHPIAREVTELLVADLEAWASSADAPVPVETETATDLDPGLSQTACELFPDLADAYRTSAHPRERVQALLDQYPARIDPRPDGYEPDDIVQSAINLLSLGNKVGTDAYKSDTSARLFLKKGQHLQRLLHKTPGLKAVPYIKGVAATLMHGRFDVDTSLDDLKDNPTLAASVMEASIKLAADKHILPKSSARLLPTDDSAMAMTLTSAEAADRAGAESARAVEEENDITTATLRVAEILRRADIEVSMPRLNRCLRSKGSMTDQLTGAIIKSDGNTQLISNAVRHLFEIPGKDFTNGFKKAMLAFDERGYAEVSTRNWFRMRDPTFLGVTTVLTTPDGYRFEVEFHTPQSFEAKIANHDTYKERGRLRLRASGDALDEATQQLAQRAREVCKGVPIPEGAREISHWGNELDARSAAGAIFGPRAAERSRMPERSLIAKEVVSVLGSRPVVLVGLPAAGKSRIGPALARRLGLAFVDTDKKIERETGMAITQIFAAKDKGKQWFRNREASLIAQLVAKGNLILATGGGSFEREETRRLILDKAVSIWLDTDRGEIWKRLANDTSRPLLRIDEAEETSGEGSATKAAIKKELFEEIVKERIPQYRQADITVVPPHKRNDNKNADACVTALHGYLCGGAGEEALLASSFQGLPTASNPPSTEASVRLKEQRLGPAAPSPASAPRSDVYGSVGSVVDLSSTQQKMPDDAHDPRVLPRKTSDGQVASLDPTASLHASLVPGATEWLGDEHIAADYALLNEQLQRDNPGLAAEMRFVQPAQAHLLRLTPSPSGWLETFQRIVHDRDGNDTARFLLVPVSDGHADDEGTHWSLLFVDRHAPEGALAYHYDSAGAHNTTVAEQLAARLGVRLQVARITRQQNGYDCGVFVVDATRALVRRLAQGERPGREPLHLDHLVADRPALQDRLGADAGLG